MLDHGGTICVKAIGSSGSRRRWRSRRRVAPPARFASRRPSRARLTGGPTTPRRTRAPSSGARSTRRRSARRRVATTIPTRTTANWGAIKFGGGVTPFRTSPRNQGCAGRARARRASARRSGGAVARVESRGGAEPRSWGARSGQSSEEGVMKDGLRFVDCDMHIMEPPDLFEKYLEPRFRSRVLLPIGADGRPKRGTIVIDGLPTTMDAELQQYRKRGKPGATNSTQP